MNNTFNWHPTPPCNKWVYFRGETFNANDFWCQITECNHTFQLVKSFPRGMKGSSFDYYPTKEIAIYEAEKFIKRKAFKLSKP